MRLSLRALTFSFIHSLSFPFLPPSTNLGTGKRATFKCLSNVNGNVRLQEMPHAALSANGNLISMCNTLRWQMLEVHLPYLTISYLPSPSPPSSYGCALYVWKQKRTLTAVYRAWHPVTVPERPLAPAPVPAYFTRCLRLGFLPLSCGVVNKTNMTARGGVQEKA